MHAEILFSSLLLTWCIDISPFFKKYLKYWLTLFMMERMTGKTLYEERMTRQRLFSSGKIKRPRPFSGTKEFQMPSICSNKFWPHPKFIRIFVCEQSALCLLDFIQLLLLEECFRNEVPTQQGRNIRSHNQDKHRLLSTQVSNNCSFHLSDQG